MAKKVIVLMNLGSPKSTELNDVKSYLDEFLMDERVIDLPYIFRYLLVKGIITRFRPAKTAAKYKSIWTKNGSPLIHTTKQLVERVQEQTGIKTYMCMRYDIPSPKLVLSQINEENPDLEDLVFMPLYPHYAISSYETALVHFKKAYQLGKYSFNVNTIPPFYDDEDYINALSSSIAPFITKDYDYILFSYHGIPVRHLKLADPTRKHPASMDNCCTVASDSHHYCYKFQVEKTTELVTKKLGIPTEKFSLAYQSRLGLDKWLTPNSVDLFTGLPKKGVEKLLVVCPAFVSDCLETLEEVEMEGKELFIENGGKEFTLIPCLNTNEIWVKAIEKIIHKY